MIIRKAGGGTRRERSEGMSDRKEVKDVALSPAAFGLTAEEISDLTQGMRERKMAGGVNRMFPKVPRYTVLKARRWALTAYRCGGTNNLIEMLLVDIEDEIWAEMLRHERKLKKTA